jgi:hypothetical protein
MAAEFQMARDSLQESQAKVAELYKTIAEKDAKLLQMSHHLAEMNSKWEGTLQTQAKTHEAEMNRLRSNSNPSSTVQQSQSSIPGGPIQLPFTSLPSTSQSQSTGSGWNQAWGDGDGWNKEWKDGSWKTNWKDGSWKDFSKAGGTFHEISMSLDR